MPRYGGEVSDKGPREPQSQQRERQQAEKGETFPLRQSNDFFGSAGNPPHAAQDSPPHLTPHPPEGRKREPESGEEGG